MVETGNDMVSMTIEDIIIRGMRNAQHPLCQVGVGCHLLMQKIGSPSAENGTNARGKLTTHHGIQFF
jgi:hypothetical protein